MKNLINEDIQTMKYLFGYKPGKVLSEQVTTPSTPPAATTGTQTPAARTPEEVIKQIQTILVTKYKQNLGNAGPNRDGVDGKWGNLTQTAFETVSKNLKPATPAAAPVKTDVASGPTTQTGAVVSGTTGTSGTTVSSGTVGTSGTSGAVMTTGEKVSDVTGPSKADDIIDDGQPLLNQGSQQALSGQLTPQQIRQQARFDQRLARQARRTARRAGEQGQQ